MIDEKMYLKLFNTITDSVRIIDDSYKQIINAKYNVLKAKTMLEDAQVETEEMYVNNELPI